MNLLKLVVNSLCIIANSVCKEKMYNRIKLIMCLSYPQLLQCHVGWPT